MKKRVTTFASDAPEDSMVQNDKDVDALMHVKITVVELYKRLLSRLDTKLYKMATFCKIGLMICYEV